MTELKTEVIEDKKSKSKKELLSEDVKKFLWGISKLSKGEKTALKRSVGRGFEGANSIAIMTYAGIVPKSATKQTEFIWFEIACMYAYNDCKTSRLPFAKALKLLDKRTSGVETKLIHLLSNDVKEQSLFLQKLSQLSKRLVTKGITPDYNNLLEDLIDWYYGDVTVRLKWAKQFKGIEENNNNK